MFEGKRVVDYGAGLSDYVDVISQRSNPRALFAVDPIYETQEMFAQAVERTLDLVNDYMEISKRSIRMITQERGTNSLALQ
jgi:hypothetical protein